MIMYNPKSHFSVEKVVIEVTWIILYETLIVNSMFNSTHPPAHTNIHIHTHTHATIHSVLYQTPVIIFCKGLHIQ